MSKDEFLESLTSTKFSNKELKDSFLVDQEDEHPCGYRALWRAVLTQALMDAGSNSGKAEFKKEKARAISWLNGDSDDFNEVCTMAGLEPSYVKRKAKEAIKNGCKWRLETNRFKKEPLENIERKVIYMEDFLSIKMLQAS